MTTVLVFAGIIEFILGFVYACHPARKPYHWVVTSAFYGWSLAFANVVTTGLLIAKIGYGPTAGKICIATIIIGTAAATVGLWRHGPTSLLELAVFMLGSLILSAALLGIGVSNREIDVVAPQGLVMGALFGVIIASVTKLYRVT